MVGAGRVFAGEARRRHNAQAVQLQGFRLGSKEAVGMEDVEGLHPRVEHLVLPALVAVVLISKGNLRVEPGRENELEHAQVFVGDGGAAVQKLSHLPGVVPHPELNVLDVFHIVINVAILILAHFQGLLLPLSFLDVSFHLPDIGFNS